MFIITEYHYRERHQIISVICIVINEPWPRPLPRSLFLTACIDARLTVMSAQLPAHCPLLDRL